MSLSISYYPFRAGTFGFRGGRGKCRIFWWRDKGTTRSGWAKEIGNPRYILDLLWSIINVSVRTVGIMEELPKLIFGGIMNPFSSKSWNGSVSVLEVTP
jgi:hypothetical protein